MRASRQSCHDFAVLGSAISLEKTPNRLRGGTATDNYVSVRELCRGGTGLGHFNLDDKHYTVPTFDWNKPKYSESREKRLDYIHTFTEKPYVEEPQELVKLHCKKRHGVPGPTAYELTKDWAYKSGKDYEQQRGRQYHHDRETNTATIIRHTKRDRYPAPPTYKPKS